MVLIGIALFLTLFIMNPVLTEIQQNAYEPYRQQAITQEQAIERAEVPLKRFMLRQTEQLSLIHISWKALASKHRRAVWRCPSMHSSVQRSAALK